ncbi:ribbon-helix-helix protein, CopG family [Cellulomonas sp. JH27-2]|uniref:ribbon-helix-helix protein, CopG family n=1 Tax=Cellulomonas sp. JH27-2 TaxID=2774139 RepID=UPI001781ED17|nr:ribbon-helix-helix protein, CopG family [Cellulomonas sp. JH27-2]MBD8059522.1 ribbon-helix-helix protein, CopG family [Cellulomonas sp. JH27-2]
MKLSVSLSDDDVRLLDKYVDEHPGQNRSSALRAAIAALREQDLIAAYEQAAEEWRESEEGQDWDSVAPARSLSLFEKERPTRREEALTNLLQESWSGKRWMVPPLAIDHVRFAVPKVFTEMGVSFFDAPLDQEVLERLQAQLQAENEREHEQHGPAEALG